jgi:hypothetical protein
LSNRPAARLQPEVADRGAKGMVDMTPENDWNAIRGERQPLLGAAGMGMLRFALLFGSVAAALALILTPVADRYAQSHFVGMDGIDYTATGSIGSPRNSYTIRRTVLQQPGSVCIIRADGQRSGDC